MAKREKEQQKTQMDKRTIKVFFVIRQTLNLKNGE